MWRCAHDSEETGDPGFEDSFLDPKVADCPDRRGVLSSWLRARRTDQACGSVQHTELLAFLRQLDRAYRGKICTW